MIEAIIIAAGVVLDQLSKYWAETVLQTETMTVIPRILQFKQSEPNTGMAFSMMSNHTWLLTIISLVMSIVLIYMIYKYRSKIPRTMRIILAFLTSGAIGNLIDRIVYGAVTDFIEFTFVKFATFNVADTFITLSGIGMLCYLIFTKEGKEFFKSLDEKKEDAE